MSPTQSAPGPKAPSPSRPSAAASAGLPGLLCAVGVILLAAPARAQTPVPENHVPSSVLMELRALEGQFDLALAQDCASELCFSKGCVYRDHVVVDLPRQSSLPGLGHTEGPGSVPVQEYLTRARCEFAHEKSIPAKDVQALVRRLEQRLSRGWLRVNVARQVLLPVSEDLKKPPKPEPEEAPAEKEEVLPPPPAPEWEAGVAMRELWVSLLPHFSWMIAVVLVTLAALVLIWAARRVGRESIEEKALAAQLAAGQLGKEKVPETANGAVPEELNGAAPGANGASHPGEDAFVSEQQRLWDDRIAQAELTRDDGVVVELLRQWLKAGEFDLLAKAIFVFGDRLSLAFPEDGELAVRKVEFAEFLRELDTASLPSDGDFFRKLNQHAISSSLLAQADAEVYRSLREEFGSAGVARLLESLPPRHGALLFAFVPTDFQHEVARILDPDQRVLVAAELLQSNRISREETAYVLEVLGAARSGKPVPPAPAAVGIADRGREFDAAGALSVLLPLVEPTQRQELFTAALQRSAGGFPSWYENILYGDMLLRLPNEMRADLLLEVDLKGLAGWSSVQDASWQESFLNQLAPSMQNALKASMVFSSRADQVRLARRGHNELVQAVKKQLARGKVSFAEIVA